MDITKKIDFIIGEQDKSRGKEYRAFFNKKLKEYGVNSPAELSDKNKKKFFNEIEREWTKEKNKNESKSLLKLHEKELSYKERKKLPKEAFVFPDERKYPIHDRKHAANALARVSQFGTAGERKKVRQAVCKKYPDMPTCKK